MTIYRGISDGYIVALHESRFFLGEGETLNGPSSSAFSFGPISFSSLVARGTINGTASDGVFFQAGASYDVLRIGATGVVRGTSHGVNVLGTDNRVINHGAITATGTDAIGVTLGGARDELVNTGTIRAANPASAGVEVSAVHAVIHNAGRMAGKIGIDIATGGGSELYNDGGIQGTDVAVVVSAVSSYVQIANAGRIVGHGSGIAMLGDRGYLDNSGVIKTTATAAPSVGVQAAISGGDGVQEIANSGKIIGDVLLAGGNDAFAMQKGGTVSGVIDGGAGADFIGGGVADDHILGGGDRDILAGFGGDDRIEGGDGNDVMSGDRGADVMHGDVGDDQMYGGGGGDIMLGGAGMDEMYGQGGNDRMEGGGDDDFIKGGAGKDVLRGEDGNDRLYGEAGNDKLIGGAGNDLLAGFGGKDVLTGGEGQDTLFGGGGNDTMRGGAGADEFVYETSDKDFGTDRIVDFENGTDKINIAAFGIDIADFVSDAVSNHNGNAVIDLSYLNPADLTEYSGTIILVGQAGNIDALDFI